MAIKWKKSNPKVKMPPPLFGRSTNPTFVNARAALGAGRFTMPSVPSIRNAFAGLGGSQGNYGGLIGGMPDLSGMEAAMAAMDRDSEASTIAALRRLAVSYGAPDQFSNMAMSDQAKGFMKRALDAQTLELARKAAEEGVAVHARQSKDDAVMRRRIPATLAGRGLLRSGQTVSDLSDQAQNYKNLQYDTLNELLGNVEGSVGSYIQGKRERELALAQARIQAAWDAQKVWGDSPIDEPLPPGASNRGVSTPPPPGSSPWRPPRGPVYPGSRAGRKVLVSRTSPFRRK